jgi:hypothetical protein
MKRASPRLICICAALTAPEAMPPNHKRSPCRHCYSPGAAADRISWNGVWRRLARRSAPKEIYAEKSGDGNVVVDAIKAVGKAAERAALTAPVSKLYTGVAAGRGGEGKLEEQSHLPRRLKSERAATTPDARRRITQRTRSCTPPPNLIQLDHAERAPDERHDRTGAGGRSRDRPARPVPRRGHGSRVARRRQRQRRRRRRHRARRQSPRSQGRPAAAHRDVRQASGHAWWRAQSHYGHSPFQLSILPTWASTTPSASSPSCGSSSAGLGLAGQLERAARDRLAEVQKRGGKLQLFVLSAPPSTTPRNPAAS